ncbi:hypothetical protein HanRHA438_Chr09g0419611 [Helianthus annuus]|nr:hypothetical protein HanRHA438_Chr09g0419611 [Helianthus annuus]
MIVLVTLLVISLKFTCLDESVSPCILLMACETSSSRIYLVDCILLGLNR